MKLHPLLINWLTKKKTALKKMKKTLDSDKLSKASEDCDYCRYRDVVASITKDELRKTNEIANS